MTTKHDDERRRHTVTVGVDGSTPALAAVQWADEQARLRGATLSVVTVWPTPSNPGAAALRSELPAYEVARSAALTVRTESDPLIDISAVHCATGPADGLLSHAAGSDLIVIGRHRGHSIAEQVLGSVTERVLGEAACPVAIVHEAPRGGYGRIVVGIDGSAASDAALEWALDHARGSGARVDAVLVWDWHAQYGVYPYADDERTQQKRAADVLNRVVSAATSTADVEVSADLVRGRPVPILLGAARDADLLVVGNSHGGVWSQRVLGSVSRRVALACPVPVVVAHATVTASDASPANVAPALAH
jgi:nucleotide-binding universal stress UspA family protein